MSRSILFKQILRLNKLYLDQQLDAETLMLLRSKLLEHMKKAL